MTMFKKEYLICLFMCICPKGIQAQTVKDIDGNVYNTITIGTKKEAPAEAEKDIDEYGDYIESDDIAVSEEEQFQQVWMLENLKVTRLNDGTPLPLITTDTAWWNTEKAVYSWYANDEAKFKNTVGALYNWYTVNTKKLCPEGWHVPSYDEWKALIMYLGGFEIAGGKLKSTDHSWEGTNAEATNETGFTGNPGGFRCNGGSSVSMGSDGLWWSSTEYEIDSAINLMLNYSHGAASLYDSYKKMGMSVRCMQ
jgi:uncharacterized protein (TIGR02145 family)